jgi:hypothetical protein
MPTKNRTKKTKKTKKPDSALARSTANKQPTENTAAVAIARAWLAKAGFHEDPDRESPERVEIGFSDVDSNGDRYVNVRVYVPRLDIDCVIDGDHIDGITTEARHERSRGAPGREAES